LNYCNLELPTPSWFSTIRYKIRQIHIQINQEYNIEYFHEKHNHGIIQIHSMILLETITAELAVNHTNFYNNQDIRTFHDLIIKRGYVISHDLVLEIYQHVNCETEKGHQSDNG
jgi:uncharacterized protein (DUF2164 family)